MANDGRALEQLVADLEELLLGTGFTITPNQRVFDADGNQVAEFDVQVEGRVGSTSFRWLIECRDRPSEGPAPGSWIQLLAGRRQLFQFDKVMAVSTTGFSPAAKHSGNDLNIALRHVTTVEQISAEFGKSEFRMRRLRLSLQGVADFKFPSSARNEALELDSTVRDAELSYAGEADFLTLSQFIRRELLQDSGIKEPDSDQSRQYTYKQRAKMELRVGARVLPVVGVAVPITVHYSYHPTTAVSVKCYGEDGSIIGEEVALSTETDDSIVRTAVLITRKDGEIIVVQNVSNDLVRK